MKIVTALQQFLTCSIDPDRWESAALVQLLSFDGDGVGDGDGDGDGVDPGGVREDQR